MGEISQSGVGASPSVSRSSLHALVAALVEIQKLCAKSAPHAAIFEVAEEAIRRANGRH